MGRIGANGSLQEATREDSSTRYQHNDRRSSSSSSSFGFGVFLLYEVRFIDDRH